MIERVFPGPFNAVALSHQWIEKHVKPGDTVVDATCGNGGDTVALAEAVGENGWVFAFDIQRSACAATQKRVTESGLKNVFIVCDSHERIGQYVDAAIDGAVFNLGFLPGGGNRRIATRAKTTVKAVRALAASLDPDGFICITSYVAHRGGRREYRALNRALNKKPLSDMAVVITDSSRRRNPSPKVLLLIKTS